MEEQPLVPELAPLVPVVPCQVEQPPSGRQMEVQQSESWVHRLNR